MKKQAKEKTVPPSRKDDRMTGKESFLSALLGGAINVMAMVFAGVFFGSHLSERWSDFGFDATDHNNGRHGGDLFLCSLDTE